MKKMKSPKRIPAKGKKGGRRITTRSVAFETEGLEALKAHEIHSERRLSISWIVNRLIDKFLAGEVSLEANFK